MKDFISKIKIQHIVFFVIAILIFFAMYYFSNIFNKGYIEIFNKDELVYSVNILDNFGNEIFTNEEIKEDFKFKTNKGNYTVIIESESSRIINAIVEGNLKSTIIDFSKDEQQGRQIVGYKPRDCITDVNGLYYSYLCDDLTYNYLALNPSKGKRPPFTSQKYIQDFGIIGTVKIDNKTLALKAEAFDDYKKYRLDVLGKDLISVSSKELNFLERTSEYKISNYNDGFLVYSADNLDIYYFKDIESEPSKIILKDFDNGIFNSNYPNKISINKYGIAIWQTIIDNQSIILEGDETDEYKINYAIYDSEYNLIKSESTSTPPVEAILTCEENYYCVVANNELSYIPFDSSNLSADYSLSEIGYINTIGDMYFSKGSYLYKYNEAIKSWNSVVNIGDNIICGLSVYQNELNTCLINPQNGTLALNIKTGLSNFDIENKVNDLRNSVNEIDGISVYKKEVFVTTDNGELVFNSSKSGYFYDSGIVAANKEKVNKAFNDLGFKQNGYNLVMQDF